MVWDEMGIGSSNQYDKAPFPVGARDKAAMKNKHDKRYNISIIVDETNVFS